jgi:hypothetical protein
MKMTFIPDRDTELTRVAIDVLGVALEAFVITVSTAHDDYDVFHPNEINNRMRYLVGKLERNFRPYNIKEHGSYSVRPALDDLADGWHIVPSLGAARTLARKLHGYSKLYRPQIGE